MNDFLSSRTSSQASISSWRKKEKLDSEPSSSRECRRCRLKWKRYENKTKELGSKNTRGSKNKSDRSRYKQSNADKNLKLLRNKLV